MKFPRYSLSQFTKLVLVATYKLSGLLGVSITRSNSLEEYDAFYPSFKQASENQMQLF